MTQDRVRVTDWIHEESTEPFLRILFGIIDYEVDRTNILAAVRETAREAQGSDWRYECPLRGHAEIHVRLSHPSGSGIVDVDVDVPAVLGGQVRMLCEIAANYRLVRPVEGEDASR